MRVLGEYTGFNCEYPCVLVEFRSAVYTYICQEHEAQSVTSIGGINP